MSMINTIITDEWCREINNYYELLKKYNDDEIINFKLEEIRELEKILIELHNLSITKISYRRIIVETNLSYEFCMTYRDLYKKFIDLVKLLNNIYKTNDEYVITQKLFMVPKFNFNELDYLKKIKRDFGIKPIIKITKDIDSSEIKKIIFDLFIEDGNI